MKLEFFRQILEKKYSNTEFNENPGLFRADGQTDVAKVMVAFSNFCERV